VALFMDVKWEFNNVCKAHLGRRMQAPEIEPDLIRWTISFISHRRVKLMLDGKTGEASPVDTGMPHRLPAAPTLFGTYLSGIFDEVKAAVPGIHGLSLVDDIGWWADGADGEAVPAKLSKAADASIAWAPGNGVAFDHVRGTISQASELQLLVNQEARATTGCFRTTNLGALSMESGLRAAAAHLENR